MLEQFIQEDPARLLLENWLKWLVSRKMHIFWTLKCECSPEPNLAEVIHSSWVTQKRTQLSIYEAFIDDICEQVTVKQMLKGFKDIIYWRNWSFFGNLLQRQKTQEDSLTSKIIDDLRCVTSQNIMHEKTPKSYEIDSDDEYLSQNKKEIQKIIKKQR